MAGTYTLPRPLLSISSPGRDPALCTPALTKLIALGFFSEAKSASNSANRLAASSASRFLFNSSSSLCFSNGVFLRTIEKDVLGAMALDKVGFLAPGCAPTSLAAK